MLSQSAFNQMFEPQDTSSNLEVSSADSIQAVLHILCDSVVHCMFEIVVLLQCALSSQVGLHLFLFCGGIIVVGTFKAISCMWRTPGHGLEPVQLSFQLLDLLFGVEFGQQVFIA